MSGAKSGEKVRAAGYVRVSQERNARNGYGLGVQEADVARYVQFKDWKPGEVYREEGVSGYEKDRPALQRLLADAKAGAFDVVIFPSIDRAARSVRDMSKQRAKRRMPSLAGTNLESDPRTGMYRWRHVDKRSGKRVRRGTGTRDLRKAILIAQKYEEEYERELVGLSNYKDYRRPLTNFVEPFLSSLASSPQRAGLLRMRLLRAFRLLGLTVLADLEDFTRIERRLLRLEGRGHGKFSRKNLADAFQAALKQFSKYLAGRRELPVDHLAPWPKLKSDGPTRVRRALTPEEIAWALVASDRLDELCSRASPMRPAWTSLLVAAPRISALAALDIVDLDRDESRLLLKGNGNKRAGAGALDEKTLQEIVAYVGNRTEGPLFLSPKGTRIERCRSLDQWRAAVSLAAVDLEWPEGEPRDLRTAYLTHYALMSGRVQVAMGGPLSGPHQPGPSKRNARKRTRSRIRDLADAIRPGWQERMRGVDQHCLRMTHRTWSLAAGVPEILIDRQLGHTSRAGDAALRAAWSAVGRAHYTDMNYLTLDSRRSARAVREMLDRAQLAFHDAAECGESALASATETGREAPLPTAM